MKLPHKNCLKKIFWVRIKICGFLEWNAVKWKFLLELLQQMISIGMRGLMCIATAESEREWEQAKSEFIFKSNHEHHIAHTPVRGEERVV